MTTLLREKLETAISRNHDTLDVLQRPKNALTVFKIGDRNLH